MIYKKINLIKNIKNKINDPGLILFNFGTFTTLMGFCF